MNIFDENRYSVNSKCGIETKIKGDKDEILHTGDIVLPYCIDCEDGRIIMMYNPTVIMLYKNEFCVYGFNKKINKVEKCILGKLAYRVKLLKKFDKVAEYETWGECIFFKSQDDNDVYKRVE